jgi:SOS response regulatory protein OraA/RecX
MKVKLIRYASGRGFEMEIIKEVIREDYQVLE